MRALVALSPAAVIWVLLPALTFRASPCTHMSFERQDEEVHLFF